MPAQLITDLERTFEIDFLTDLPAAAAIVAAPADIGLGQTLGGNLDIEPVLRRAAGGDHRQTAAIASDRRADLDPGHVILRADTGAQIPARLQLQHHSDISHDPGEHRSFPLRLRLSTSLRARALQGCVRTTALHRLTSPSLACPKIAARWDEKNEIPVTSHNKCAKDRGLSKDQTRNECRIRTPFPAAARPARPLLSPVGQDAAGSGCDGMARQLQQGRREFLVRSRLADPLSRRSRGLARSPGRTDRAKAHHRSRAIWRHPPRSMRRRWLLRARRASRCMFSKKGIYAPIGSAMNVAARTGILG